MPRILSLAAERTKFWYDHPKKCPLLLTKDNRKIRSERREACLVVLETLLSHLDLASLCLGVPTLANGFIDIDMKIIVRDSGLGQRRCERAIRQIKEAGFSTSSTWKLTRKSSSGPSLAKSIDRSQALSPNSFKQFGMGARANENNQAVGRCFRESVGKQKISADVTFTISLPSTYEWVIGPFRCERPVIGNQQQHDFLESPHIVSA
ncbi:hypothetical protein DesfrDRAFT_1670 [Solidesulfovibrio fructosivorans JJ]]|uniref:Uncharacterized protein n=1 Tax=Solidesulfovibrio fructosivorans JJ] TaxID=596151 RepID=E1JVM1_SOLFR|nr:hypothetical protein DesfrDRAFT_1670 [Solidesulfovibrio fructosivorans JJ]]